MEKVGQDEQTIHVVKDLESDRSDKLVDVLPSRLSLG